MSKCRGESDLGLCMTSGLAKRIRLRSGVFRFKNSFGRKSVRRILWQNTSLAPTPPPFPDLKQEPPNFSNKTPLHIMEVRGILILWSTHACVRARTNKFHSERSFRRRNVDWSERLHWKSTKLLKSISAIQASKSQTWDLRDFFEVKVCSSNRNVKFENFMHSEWKVEKFLKGNVGNKMRLPFWNMHQQIDLVFMQLAGYKWKHARVVKYQHSLPNSLAHK